MRNKGSQSRVVLKFISHEYSKSILIYFNLDTTFVSDFLNNFTNATSHKHIKVYYTLSF